MRPIGMKRRRTIMSIPAMVAILSLVAATCGNAGTAAIAPPVDGMVMRYGSLTEREIDIDADGTNVTAAVEGINRFSVDLYRSMAESHTDNFVASPYTVTFALGMIYAGAAGDTAAEMRSVLHADLPPADWQEGVNAYDLSLHARTSGSPTEWHSANKVWAEPGLPWKEEYLDMLTGVYGSPLAEADFAGGADVERSIINDWVAEQTRERIDELFPPGSIDPTTRLVLVNAIALDAPWEFPFDPELTSPGQFTRLDGSAVNVPMMRYDEFLPSGSGPDFTAVELPYGGGALSMVVIEPTDLPAFEADLSLDKLDQVIDSIAEGGIHLSMPSFSGRTHVQLNDMLSDLGMPSAFGAGADFSAMVTGGGLRLDTVEHEAFIEVDEAGTRAAAATGGSMALSHGPTVMIDQPFLYLIRDRGAGTILFIGRVADPSITG